MGSADAQLVGVGIDVERDHSTIDDLAGEELCGELVLDGGLHQPAQRSSVIDGVEAVAGEPFLAQSAKLLASSVLPTSVGPRKRKLPVAGSDR